MHELIYQSISMSTPHLFLQPLVVRQKFRFVDQVVIPGPEFGRTKSIVKLKVVDVVRLVVKVCLRNLNIGVKVKVCNWDQMNVNHLHLIL